MFVSKPHRSFATQQKRGEWWFERIKAEASNVQRNKATDVKLTKAEYILNFGFSHWSVFQWFFLRFNLQKEAIFVSFHLSRLGFAYQPLNFLHQTKTHWMHLELRSQDQDGSISSSFASCSFTKAPRTARIPTLYNILVLLTLKNRL